jgi:hypothetical protein
LTISFLADEDLDANIIRGLRSREPAIDILSVKTSGLRGAKDTNLLELAVREDRIILSHDRSTMSQYFVDRWQAGGSHMPGLFLVPQHRNVGEIIEVLLLIWAASEPDEWRDQITYLPFR